MRMRNPFRLRWQRQAATGAVAVFSIAFVIASSSGVPSPESLLLSPLLASASHVAKTGNGSGYWVASADGGVFAFGTAKFYGSMAAKPIKAPITGIIATADDKGYWLVAQDGGVFGFGDALYQGSMAGQKLAAPVVGIASSTSGSATPGAAGARGPAGAPGTPGAPGAPAAANYAYVFNQAAETVAVEADTVFDSNGSLLGFTHSAGTAAIVVVTTGHYRIDFSASGTQVSQFAVFVNGVVAAGSDYGSGAGTQQNNGSLILSLTAGDSITLRNHTSAAAVGLATAIGGSQANVNASMLIEQLG
jgi:BclA C-terminal domain